MDVNINDLLDVTSQFTAGKLVADITFRLNELYAVRENLIIEQHEYETSAKDGWMMAHQSLEEVVDELTEVDSQILKLCIIKKMVVERKHWWGTLGVKEESNARKDDITITGNKQDSFHPL